VNAMSAANHLPPDDATHPLKGLNVLLTRPALQATRLTKRIEVLGGTVQSLPLLEIDPILDKPSIERVKTKIMGLDQYDVALFISTNAASLGMEWISQYWPQLPVGLDAYAVGPSTGELLQQLPWQVHYSSTGITSEHLLELPGLQDIAGKRVALFRGQGGRELLAQTLRERGARVDYIELYQRRVPIYDREETLAQMRSNRINIAVLTSMQILESFLRLLGPRVVSLDLAQEMQDKADAALLSSLCIVVPSRRLKDVAIAAGFSCVIEASGADDESILDSLTRSSGQVEAM
jgi:uroporphyrinogen-III synthase